MIYKFDKIYRSNTMHSLYTKKAAFLTTLLTFLGGAPSFSMHQPSDGEEENSSGKAEAVGSGAQPTKSADFQPLIHSKERSLLASMQSAGKFFNKAKDKQAALEKFYKLAMGEYKVHSTKEMALHYNSEFVMLNIGGGGVFPQIFFEDVSDEIVRAVLIGTRDRNTTNFLRCLKQLTEKCQKIKVLELYDFDLVRLLNTYGIEISEHFSKAFPEIEELMVVESGCFPAEILSKLPNSLRSVRLFQNNGQVMDVRSLSTLKHTDYLKPINSLEQYPLSTNPNNVTLTIAGSMLLVNIECIREVQPSLESINGKAVEEFPPADASTLLGPTLPLLEEKFGLNLRDASVKELAAALPQLLAPEYLKLTLRVPLEIFLDS